MIAVCCGESEREAAAELFQLFKVPWRFAEGKDVRQDAVIVSAGGAFDELPPSSLLLAFSSSSTLLDEKAGIELGQTTSGANVSGAIPSLALMGPTTRIARAESAYELLSDRGGAVALSMEHEGARFIRCGYDLFSEIAALLDRGQETEPAEPTLEHHIQLIRDWIVSAGVPLVEVPPVRSGHPFAVCLTHDIDFISLRQHKLDRTFFGFLYRAVIGSARDLLAGRGSVQRLLRNWLAALSLPLVYLHLLPDPWSPFDSYTSADGSPATFYIVPFPDRPGERLLSRDAGRRAVRYDAVELRPVLRRVARAGNEVAVHGIDAWHSVHRGRAERKRIEELTGLAASGVRMHWLWWDDGSARCLEAAGFDYDATGGFNDAVGFKAGTTQVFRPLGAERLLELPLHVQDTALFYPGRMHLGEKEAWSLVTNLRRATKGHGGVLTISWHDRSLAPERLWDGFYRRLLEALRQDGAWFGTAREIVDWFRARRSIVFTEVERDNDLLRVHVEAGAEAAEAGFVFRAHLPTPHGPKIVETEWSGEGTVTFTLENAAKLVG